MTLEGDNASDIYTRDVAIPPVLAQAGKLVIMFRAQHGRADGRCVAPWRELVGQQKVRELPRREVSEP